MKISLNQLINHLPDDSQFKTLLGTLGESGDSVDATVEFYHLVEAFYQAQQAYNQQPGNKAINAVSEEVARPVIEGANGTIYKMLERSLTFYRKYEDAVIAPKI
ncbi:hypothetical protein ACOKW7_14995 [Limnospira platensis CENA597]|uniref:hypothetical protein n=1 Tax=Limnospira platensis TaxID=118562 RepID=UPI003D9FB7F1